MDTCKKINLQLAIRFLDFTFIKRGDLGGLHKKIIKTYKEKWWHDNFFASNKCRHTPNLPISNAAKRKSCQNQKRILYVARCF